MARTRATGQIVALALDSGEPELLLGHLVKPTGIALLGDALWIASGNDLLRAPLLAEGIGQPETVLDDLPFNGRSNGTLTVTPDGFLLFETSGRRRGNDAADRSAMLWKLDPADPTNPVPLASGLKGAYAHAVDAAGRLWLTEIGDDPVNGAPPPDELNLLQEGANFGWPGCFGFQQPALNFGGSEALCAATRAPVVLFPPQSTPVSVAPSPWEENVLLVALWGPTEPMVARVAADPCGRQRDRRGHSLYRGDGAPAIAAPPARWLAACERLWHRHPVPHRPPLSALSPEPDLPLAPASLPLGVMTRRKRLLLFPLLALCLLALLGVAVAPPLRDVTGEENPWAQLRGVGHLLSGFLRPYPATAPLEPVRHAGLYPFGLNTFLQTETEPDKVERSLDMIAEAGFRWIRQEFTWEDLEIHQR